MSNAAVVLIGVLMVAASTAPSATAGPTATAALMLDGPTWRLTSLSGQDHNTLAAASRGVTARFGAGRLEGFSGCNQYAGTYAIQGDRVTIGPLAGTMMACEEPAMTIENSFRGAFTGAVRYTIAEDRLTLTSDSGATMIFQVVPPATLEGGTWEITAFNNGRHAVKGVVTGTTLTLSFRDGAVVGESGCNTYRAAYKRDGSHVSIGPMATTRKACAGQGVMEQEQQFLAALESATSWAIDGDLLDMHRADSERALMAHRHAK
jgi:heat shock protein HslJ